MQKIFPAISKNESNIRKIIKIRCKLSHSHFCSICSICPICPWKICQQHAKKKCSHFFRHWHSQQRISRMAAVCYCIYCVTVSESGRWLLLWQGSPVLKQNNSVIQASRGVFPECLCIFSVFWCIFSVSL